MTGRVTVLVQFELAVAAIEHGTVAVYRGGKTVLANRDIQPAPVFVVVPSVKSQVIPATLRPAPLWNRRGAYRQMMPYYRT